MLPRRRAAQRTRDQRVRVLALTVHPPSVAATRLRLQQYAPHLDAAGVDLAIWTFFRERDLRSWFGSSHVRRAGAALRGLLRVPSALIALRRADAVIVHREVLPFGPPLLELLAARRRPMVWDVDDAIWESFVSPTAGRVPRWLRATGDKHRRTCKAASEVWAGSDVLAGWCRKWNTAVSTIPTVVEVPTERPPRAAERTLGWIGTHSTGPFLEQVLPALAAIEPAPRVVVVGASPSTARHSGVEVQAWSPETEEATLARTRVGLYPVDRTHPLAEGKCGLKAILYMSRGIPSVVTPTTTNAVIVRDAVDGLHAETPEDWVRTTRRLLDDDALWERCSTNSHARALEAYSLQAWAPVVRSRLLALLQR